MSINFKIDSPDKQALAFIATYDTKDAGEYEKRIVKIARTWRSIMHAKQSVQRIVDQILSDFEDKAPDDYGCGWEDLKEKFTKWAVEEEWAESLDS